MKAADRYVVFEEIASGGMATVHIGRLLGAAGFARTVAVKRLHPLLASDPAFVAMFIDEARLAARIAHPNVVHTLDVVRDHGELLLIMEYVRGESLARLIRLSAEKSEPIPPAVAANVVAGALHGLHAAHEAVDDSGRPLDLVHRDVSPQNILVGVDGVARILDFGVAKALGRRQQSDGGLKGKLGYLAPEQLNRVADKRTDVYAASVVLWEALTGRRLFSGTEGQAEVLGAILFGDVPRPSTLASGVSPALETAVMRGLARDANERFPTAREMALALQQAEEVLPPSTIGAWVEHVARDELAARMAVVRRIESSALSTADNETLTSSRNASDPGRTITMIVPASQSSKQVATTDDRRSPTPTRGRRIWTSVLALALLGSVFAVGVLSSKFGRSTTEASPASVPTPATSAVLVVSPPGEPPAPSASGSTTSSVSPPAPTARRPRSTPARSAHPQPSCAPPYREIIVDGHVRRIPIPECL